MSNFLAGFAAEGVKQLDRYAADQKEKAKIEDARKYNESRYEIERKDRKSDRLEDINLEYRLKDYDDVSRFHVAEDGKTVMGSTRSVDAEGRTVIEFAPVTDTARLNRWAEYNSAKVTKARKDELSLENDELSNKEKRFKVGTMAEDWALEKGVKLSAIRENEAQAARAARESGDGAATTSKTVDSFAESMAKNKKVFFRSQKDANSFVAILKNYGFKTGADLAREYMSGNPKAIRAMNLAQEHLYFPEEEELDDNGKRKIGN